MLGYIEAVKKDQPCFMVYAYENELILWEERCNPEMHKTNGINETIEKMKQARKWLIDNGYKILSEEEVINY